MMPTIDVTDAAQRLLANKTVTPGHCLMYVSRAIRNGAQPLIWSGLDTALNCWIMACGDKHTSRDVPKGFPAFLGATRHSKAGDVMISLGDGTFAATDYPGWGTVGICTLEQREKQTGRKYLGYAGEFLGYTLTATATASLDPTPIHIEQDDDMTLFYKPRDNSSPLKDGLSRIWAGNRTVAGIDYADVWGIADNGEGKRLTRKQWVDLYATAEKKGITLPVIECSGNELEQIVYAPKL